ncbi:alpha-glucan family phosphorylase [Ramlibacter sp.]|uniref:alpha-glucan family phosphorylase n=1 Tax=Ramlibacter sp. TaxID=1917967 RepID=UPI002D0E5F9C|nr:alpha-glucan family phosphorylase [Ramlibacter sp.]HWI80773.1 alpha-glucan family phosphorylase [Ramlibacter sp.]
MKTSATDPVCGMTVLPDSRLSAHYKKKPVYFCSAYCREKFAAQPERYLPALVASSADQDKAQRRIAYFSMEVAVQSDMPIYSGGLGVLAGDMLKSCADLRLPLVAVSLLYRKGYFDQSLDAAGTQKEAPVQWEVEKFVQPLAATIELEIERRTVKVRAWQYTVAGQTGHDVPLILLDTDLEGNAPEDRALVHHLYGGDQKYRLAQEVLLGIGGVKMLRALGYGGLQKYHMNEGHASLLVLELLGEGNWHRDAPDFASVRNRCVFTTHTPVPAGHDHFDHELLEQVLPPGIPRSLLEMLGGRDELNMTRLGFNLSRYVNGVARRHGEVSREMFPGYSISHITNGVHSATWTCESFRRVYDRHLPGWSNDPAMLRHAIGIPRQAFWDAHQEAKGRLIALVRERSGVALDPQALTIVFARRATAYKRADLVFSDVERLRKIARAAGPLQFVFAGKAHPRDVDGKKLIKRVVGVSRKMAGDVSIVYLENYDMDLAKVLVAGADIWLNTPQRPLEASGTSGMKAAHNGVPSFSTLDGWWLEGHVEGLTGWSIGSPEAGRYDAGKADAAKVNRQDAEDLYRKLERDIMPVYYGRREQWVDIMRSAVALNASYFNTHRMVQEYATNAYLR